MKYISLFVFLTLSFNLQGQSDSDFTFISTIASKDLHIKKVVNPVKVSLVDNELDLSLKLLYLFYKNFISSQDGSKCFFHPSCSDYGVQCVGKFGVIRGGVMTLDRLVRCNGLSPSKYEIDKDKRKYIDLIK